jgi:replicative DNA helicase
MSNELVSLEVEKNCVAGILRFPNIITDLPSEITPEDFSLEVHKVIFSVIRNISLNGQRPDTVLVADHIRNLGYMVKDDFNIYEYVEALSIIQISEKAVFSYFQELKKYSICRNIDETALVMREALRHNLTRPAPDIIHAIDKIYNKQLDLYSRRDEEVVDIYSRMETLLLERASNPVEEMGIATPFPVFNRYFGGLRPGNVYVWASRPGEGKSTLLNYISNQIALKNNKIKVLYLDTEMETNDIILRMAATMCDVPMWYLDTGNWAKNPEMYRKVMAAMKLIKANRSPNFFHRYVANVNIDEVISIIRRWYYSTCKRLGEDTQAIIVYDYLKLTGERVNADNKEYQIIGEKVNKLKDIVTVIGAPLLTAVQVNRTGVNSNKSGEQTTDDDSIIALSDRIKWFCTYLGIFRHKTYLEIDADGPQFGTHAMFTLKGRFQGRESQGHLDFVKIEREGQKPAYRPNYINYNITNFGVEERSCLRDMLKKQLLGQSPSNNKAKDFYDDTLI